MNAKIPAIILLTALLLPAIVPAFAQALAITTPAEGAEYNPSDTLTVEGTAPSGAVVTVRLYNPADTIISISQVTAASDGSYSAILTTFPAAPTATFAFGTYTVSVFSAGDTVENTIEFAEAEVVPPVTPTLFRP